VTKNTRYGSDVRWETVADAVVRPEPISLSQAEVGESVTELPEPVPVRAWIRFPESPVRVEGVATAATADAVHVEFVMRDGRRRRAWVWRSAVKKRGQSRG
jgi:hypothetical protein